jgi:hypothetical protein
MIKRISNYIILTFISSIGLIHSSYATNSNDFEDTSKTRGTSLISPQRSNSNILVLGIDGARADTLQNILNVLAIDPQSKDVQNTLNFFNNSVADFHVYSGGRDWDHSQQQVKSDPNWTTLFTGAYGNVTKVVKNGDIPYYNENWPTIFTWFNYLHEEQSNTFMFHDWHWGKIAEIPINIEGKKYINSKVIRKYGTTSIWKSADKITADVIKNIDQVKNPTMIWTHFDNPDHTGHAHHWSSDPDSNYGKAYTRVLVKYLSQIFYKIEQSRKNGKEWLVIILTDHGGHGNQHGNKVGTIDNWRDTQTFVVYNDCLSKDAEFCSKSGQMEINTAVVGNDSPVATILNYLTDGNYQKISHGILLKGYPLNSSPERHTILPSSSNNSIYFRIDIPLMDVDRGYPRPINDNTFPELSKFIRNTNNYNLMFTNENNSIIYLMNSKAKIVAYKLSSHKIIANYDSLNELFPNFTLGEGEEPQLIWYSGSHHMYVILTKSKQLLGYNNSLHQMQSYNLKTPFPLEDLQFASNIGDKGVLFFVKNHSADKLIVYRYALSGEFYNWGDLNDNNTNSSNITGLQTYQNSLNAAVTINDKLYVFTQNLINDLDVHQ